MHHCDKYQEIISALLDGELAEQEAAELHAHIAVCPECRRMYDAFRFISAEVSADLEEPPKELASGVMFKVRNTKTAAPKKRRKITHFAALAACLAVVVFAASQLDTFKGGSFLSAADESAIYDAKVMSAEDCLPIPEPESDAADFASVLADCAESAPESAYDDYDGSVLVQNEQSKTSMESQTTPAGEPNYVMNAQSYNVELAEKILRDLSIALPETLHFDDMTLIFADTTELVPHNAAQLGTVAVLFPDELPALEKSGIRSDAEVYTLDKSLYLQIDESLFAVYR